MIQLKSSKEIENIRKASRIVALVLEDLENFVSVGCSTSDLNKRAEALIGKESGIPAFKGYKGYPASICTSVNETVIHGIPGDYRLKDGDIIGLDVGVRYNGYCGDAARTVAIGSVKPDIMKLINVTRQALDIAITKACVGNRIHDISNAIQTHAEKNGFSVVRDYVGHGIGTDIHEDPSIPNYGAAGTGPRIQEGMVLAIEAMVNMGTYKVRLLKEGWGVVTADGKPSAHFEHTVAVTEGGPEVLTIG
jgi:methionyl aminopeptidase